MVPAATPRSYYDQPVLKQPVWTWEIPVYFAVGGAAGASSVLAWSARRSGDLRLARVAERVAAAGALVSPALLVSDLGRPARFANMLRVVKPTSPMNVGAWVLAVYGPAAVAAEVLAEVSALPRLRRIASGVAAVSGPALATYTAVLLADTAVPVWHEARRELPFAFVGGAVQGAASVALAALAPADAASSRRLLVVGAAVREASTRRMEHRLGPVADAFRVGRADRYRRASTALSAAAVALALTAGRRRRGAAVVAGGLGVVGAACERFAVLAAGAASAADPHATIGPQRERVDRRDGAPRENLRT